MAIRYPTSGSIISATIAADTKAILLDAWKDELVLAGWTSTSIAGYVVLTFTGVPSNGNTCVFDGVTYTFRTTINNSIANEVLIGANATACGDNLAAAINGGAGSGTTYSSATSAHATCTASASSGVVTVSYATAGSAGASKTASETLNNATLDSTVFRFAGYKLDTAVTPHGLSGRMYIYDAGAASTITIKPSSVDETAIAAANLPTLPVSAGRTFQVVATAHTSFIWTPGSATLNTSDHHVFVVPYIREPQRAIAISGAANNGSGLVRITATAHGFTTGTVVTIHEVKIGGNYSSAVNGSWTVTVIDANTLDLQGSTWPGGTYTASTGTVAGPGQLSRCILSMGASSNSSWRTSPNVHSNASFHFVSINQNYWDSSGLANGIEPIKLLVPADTAGNVSENWGGFSDLAEARIETRAGVATSNYRIGDVWAAFIVTKSVSMDVTKNSFDGHNWINFMHANAKCSLWLATS